MSVAEILPCIKHIWGTITQKGTNHEVFTVIVSELNKSITDVISSTQVLVATSLSYYIDYRHVLLNFESTV